LDELPFCESSLRIDHILTLPGALEPRLAGGGSLTGVAAIIGTMPNVYKGGKQAGDAQG
jgi:hypothetical protein